MAQLELQKGHLKVAKSALALLEEFLGGSEEQCKLMQSEITDLWTKLRDVAHLYASSNKAKANAATEEHTSENGGRKLMQATIGGVNGKMITKRPPKSAREEEDEVVDVDVPSEHKKKKQKKSAAEDDEKSTDEHSDQEGDKKKKKRNLSFYNVRAEELETGRKKKEENDDTLPIFERDADTKNPPYIRAWLDLGKISAESVYMRVWAPKNLNREETIRERKAFKDLPADDPKKVECTKAATLFSEARGQIVTFAESHLKKPFKGTLTAEALVQKIAEVHRTAYATLKDKDVCGENAKAYKKLIFSEEVIQRLAAAGGVEYKKLSKKSSPSKKKNTEEEEEVVKSSVADEEEVAVNVLSEYATADEGEEDMIKNLPVPASPEKPHRHLLDEEE